MTQQLYITGAVAIRDNIISDRNGVFFAAREKSQDDFMTEAYLYLKRDYPKFYKMDRYAQLGYLAAEVLLKDRKLTERYSPESIALVLSNANGSLDTDLRYFDTTKTMASPALFVYTLPNMVAGEISIRHGLKGETAFFVTPRFDPAWMASYVDMVMASSRTQVCVAGWVEAMDDQHDVFLYLIEKKAGDIALAHDEKQLTALYNRGYGKVDGGSEKADH